MPTNEPNLDSSYILDFGDIIEIQLVGQEDSTESYRIKRDGSINISDIGKIMLSGLSVNDASSLIKAKVNTSYIGTQAFISLTNIRDINILVAGNAFNPGIYTLNGNSNMLHALSMAGGINKIGSYRDISLIRDGVVIDNLDLYDVLIYGKYNFSTGLRSGDSIVVNPIKDVIALETGVLRPALYEIKEGENFQTLLKFANGYNADANKSSILLKRFQNGVNNVIELKSDEIDSYEFNDNDSIFIKEYKVNNVVIKGAIKNPGSYKLSNGDTLSSLIKLAGGYEDTAYPFAGFLENKKALEVNNISKERLYNKFIDTLLSNSSGVSFEESGITLLLQQIKDANVSGRVIAEFDIDLIDTDPELDTILEDGDRILIPNITQQVYIQGEVSSPGAVRYSPSKDVNYYIQNAGGELKTSDIDNIFIVQPNGETINLSSQNSRLSFIFVDDSNTFIYPGSIIYVPRTTNLTNSLQSAAIWAPLISSLALSLTSLSVLNNN
jgi:protein involved in polysaccharide export with SLBB domain